MPEFARTSACRSASFRNRGGWRLHDAVQAVFPHLDVLIAYRLLFGIYSGIVPDGIADLVIDDIDWAGDSTILLSYVKGRTAAESLNLPRPAVRLLEQWLAHSAAAAQLHRAAGHAASCGWGSARPGTRASVREDRPVAVQRWVRRHGSSATTAAA